MSDVILDVKNLKKYFKTPRGMLHAVDDVSFQIKRGRTLGIVGESGCGKSTTGRAILRLIEPTAGEVIFDGEDVVKISKQRMREKRKEMQIIFQDPYSSLNPRMCVADLIADPLKTFHMLNGEERKKRVFELMDMTDRIARPQPIGGRKSVQSRFELFKIALKV